MRKLRTLLSCLVASLLAGCASDGARMAPIEAREVRRQAATVSGSSAPAAPPVAVKPSNPDAPKVMALPDVDRSAIAPTALPTPGATPLPAPGSTPSMQTPDAPALTAPAIDEASMPPASAPMSIDPRKATQPAAVRQLLEEAEAARQAADFVRARAVLERGVKVAPREPELWYRLAEVAFAERDWDQCQSLAQRAASLAREAPDLRARAQALEQAAVAKGASSATH